MEATGRLTVYQAYLAMYKYLEELYRLTKSDDLAGFLGGMSLLPDGQPADPAVWTDWNRIVQEVIQHGADAGLKLSNPSD
jgi:hypothetical protein